MSVFRDSLVFFDQIGLYDVVLPFLLVFTLVFATLEKSRLFGSESDKKSKKNLNAMVAFCVGFFVVASAQLVSLINQFVANVALVLVILVMFMLLLGALHSQQKEEGLALPEQFKWLMWVVLVAVALIFLDGVGWLEPLWSYVTGNWNSELMGIIILFGIIVGFIAWVTNNGEPKPTSDKK